MNLLHKQSRRPVWNWDCNILDHTVGIAHLTCMFLHCKKHIVCFDCCMILEHNQYIEALGLAQMLVEGLAKVLVKELVRELVKVLVKGLAKVLEKVLARVLAEGLVEGSGLGFLFPANRDNRYYSNKHHTDKLKFHFLIVYNSHHH